MVMTRSLALVVLAALTIGVWMPSPDGRFRGRDLASGEVTSRTFAADIQSDNFVEGSAGWRIKRDTGDAEFNDVTVRGTIDAVTGTLSDLTVDGTIEVGTGGAIQSDDYAAGTSGWKIDDSGAEFNTITLRDQLIGPDSLGITWVSGGGQSTNFSLPTTGTDRVTASIAVPSWATEALVFLNAHMSVNNSTGSTDFGYLSAQIGGVSSGEQFAGIQSGGWIHVSTSTRRILSGGSLGSSIALAGRVRAGAATWTAQTANTINIDGFALFRK